MFQLKKDHKNAKMRKGSQAYKGYASTYNTENYIEY